MSSVTMNCYADYMESLVHQVCIHYSCIHCKANSCTIGRHCCLFCQIDSKSLSIPRQEQGTHRDRTLQTLQDDFSGFTKAGGNIKKAKMFNNVISPYFFDIPIDQVKIPICLVQYINSNSVVWFIHIYRLLYLPCILT